MNRRISVLGVIVRDGNLLCVRHKPYNQPQPVDFWCLPGGGLEPNESLAAGVKRELVEETGVEPDVGNLLYVQQFREKSSGKEFIEFFFYVTNPQDYLKIDLSKTSHGEIEIAEIDFIDPAQHNVLPKFLQTEKFKNLESQAPKLFNYL